ncbi:serine/threonine-protein kinase [Streptomyces argenteolus]|uniref:non-specific serine/threonine protein kinase n=1 Tax=Streptomyces argenteolus TaxID=67274 RepID=A0ABW6X1R4_9ACTN
MAGARVEPLGGGDPAALGPYELLGRLASGGMGRIYLARSSGGRLVAVKTLLAEGVVSDVDRRRFTREVELAQRIDSAFTARVRDADPGAERPWMAIDYIAAPSLSELVRSAGVLPGSAVRWLAAGTAEALVTLHGEGIIHRDLKPQNILLPLAGPRVIDFGISHANDLTRTTLTLGTIAFTSPEQARGEPSTEASDVYSLGATLFHLALGRPPYRADSDTLALLARVQRGELDLEGLPKELATLIRPCLAADPRQRPVPAEMLDRFRRSLAGLPVSQDGRRWLPQRWTDLITQYERQGRVLARGAGSATGDTDPEGLTADLRTDVVPPPDSTRVYTRERERVAREQAERERAERERAEKEEAERERARVAQERLREQEWQRELERRKAEEDRRRAEEKARREAAKRERERAEQQAARERAARGRQQAPRASSGSAGMPSRPARPAPAPSAPAPSGKSSSVVGVLVVLAVIAFFVWQNARAGSSDGEGGSGLTSSASPTTGAAGSTSVAGSGTGYEPDPEPTPDADDEAFGAVSTGDCLTAYDDGYGDWSTDTPKTVDCDAADAYLRVTSTEDGISGSGCPGGSGESFWSHVGSVTEFSTTLCVERQFRVGECFVAKHRGDRMTDARLMTVWSCGADTVPKGYDVILQITGRWRAESTYPPGYCSRSGTDAEDYWRFEVNDDRTVLCVRWV